MSDASVPGEHGLVSADRAVLECVATCRASYPAVVAHRTGLPRVTAARRCEALADAGLLEAVSHEPLYRPTAAGRAEVRRE